MPRQRLMVAPSSVAAPAFGSPVAPAGAGAEDAENSHGSAVFSFSTSPS